MDTSVVMIRLTSRIYLFPSGMCQRGSGMRVPGKPFTMIRENMTTLCMMTVP